MNLPEILTPERWAAMKARTEGNHDRLVANHPLNQKERSVHSQNGEDGVLEEIFARIGTTNRYYVEFGARDGFEFSNTAHLREHLGWSGLLMDCSAREQDELNLRREFIDANNVNAVFAKHGVPKDFDFLSLDVDGIDWYIWKALEYRPRVVIVEYNPCLPNDVPMTMEYDTNHMLDVTIHGAYFGANLLAFIRLARQKGYRFATTVCWNAIFVADADFPALGIPDVPEQTIIDDYFFPDEFWYNNSARTTRPFVEPPF